jgi:hypothetical protein
VTEPTAEMVSAFELASWANGQEEDVAAGLAAVLAIVERDRCMQPRGHAVPLAHVSDPCLCGADLGPPWDSTPHQKGTPGCREGKLPADEHHFDTACDDRPYCHIAEHHDVDAL